MCISDVCVYEKPKIYSFDKKELLLPQTDCELILAGDCESQQKQLLVSAKYEKDQKPEVTAAGLIIDVIFSLSFRIRSNNMLYGMHR